MGVARGRRKEEEGRRQRRRPQRAILAPHPHRAGRGGCARASRGAGKSRRRSPLCSRLGRHPAAQLGRTGCGRVSGRKDRAEEDEPRLAGSPITAASRTGVGCGQCPHPAARRPEWPQPQPHPRTAAGGRGSHARPPTAATSVATAAACEPAGRGRPPRHPPQTPPRHPSSTLPLPIAVGAAPSGDSPTGGRPGGAGEGGRDEGGGESRERDPDVRPCTPRQHRR